jgi:hypothetical protein
MRKFIEQDKSNRQDLSSISLEKLRLPWPAIYGASHTSKWKQKNRNILIYSILFLQIVINILKMHGDKLWISNLAIHWMKCEKYHYELYIQDDKIACPNQVNDI